LPPFEIIEHTADIGIRAFGASETEVFENAAVGMFSLISDLEKIREDNDFNIEIEAEDRETLLVEWLNELIYLYDSQELLLKSFRITSLKETALRGIAYGEHIDPSRHDLNADIKAATYHMLKIKKGPDGWIAEIIFDV